MCNIKQSDIETIIDGLKDAIVICNQVDEQLDDYDYKRSFPYAAGYSRAAMQNAIFDLKSLLEQ